MKRFKIYYTISETYSTIIEAKSKDEAKKLFEDREFEDVEWEDTQYDSIDDIYITEV